MGQRARTGAGANCGWSCFEGICASGNGQNLGTLLGKLIRIDPRAP